MTNDEYITWGEQHWKNAQMEPQLHAVLGIGSEAGELMDLYKKNLARSVPIDPEQIVDEVGDLLYYVARLLKTHGKTFEEAMAKNVIKLDYRMVNGKNKAVEFALQQEWNNVQPTRRGYPHL